MKSKYIIWLFLIVLFQPSCKKWIEVNPPVTGVTGSSAYASDATAISVMTGVYANMSSAFFANGGLISMSLFPGLSADELSVFGSSNPVFTAYYTNDLTSTNTGGSDFWINIYPLIYTINSVIQGVQSSSDLTPAVKEQLLGEAFFMRAFCYFYLVNLYGDVPLVIGTNYTLNATLPRTPQTQVWQQIIADLKYAQSTLSTNYVDGTLVNSTNQRLRPTQWAADALLARAYLYQQKWDSAVMASTAVINNSSLYALDTLNGVFLTNSNESIWQLQSVKDGQNTQDALLFILPSSGPGGSYPVYLNPILVNAFEPGDQRRVNWVDSVIVGASTYYYAFKYKVNSSTAPVSEDETILRLGEQYLIRSEAEAELSEYGMADSDLNIVRTRAGLQSLTFNQQSNLLTAIYHERQVELFTEWGHRWLDLKRTGTVDSIMGMLVNECVLKGGVWNNNSQWYPIPLSEMQSDLNLVQNSGY